MSKFFSNIRRFFAKISIENKIKNPVLREIYSWCKVIIWAVFFAFLLDYVVFVNAVIPSASMETTIMTGDRVFGLRFAYRNSDPQRGDIVIFEFPDDESQLFIKRVIGLPGETVTIKDGKVYIDDATEPLVENYVYGTPIGDFGPYVVPEGAYFMMGDNRNNSLDSRFWNNTYVFKNKIKGKAFFRYWPNPSLVK